MGNGRGGSTMTFEEYLVEKHAMQYYGTDDMMPDDYIDWISSLDIEEIIEWAQKWHDKEIEND